MDYTSILLDAFESDLLQRRVAGASDVVFKGATGMAEVRASESLGLENGMPAHLLEHVIVSLFGERRIGALTWRGFRMSAQPIKTGEKFTDVLVVRLAHSVQSGGGEFVEPAATAA